MSENKELPIIFHSKKSIASMCLTSLPIELIQGVLSILIFFFYEAELGLSSLLAGMGILVYAVYDAFNDPCIGWLTDRPFKFTKKWGRRFPFVVIFFLPMLLCFLLIFSPPAAMQSSQMGMFGWLVFSTCLFDTIESFFTVNYWSITPDKYRDQGERRTVSTFEVYLGFIGVILSFLIPPMIISFGDISSYALMAWICVAVSTICWFFMIPGIRDDQETVDRYLASSETQERDSFFKSVKAVVMHKNYMAFLLLYVLYQAMIQLMQASTFYHTRFVLGESEETVTIMILVMMLGALISIPFWAKFTKKTEDNRKTWLICAVFMAIFAAPLTFMTSLIGDLIILFLWGLAFGGFWIMITPTYSDVIDESVVESGRRKESTYGGLRQFFVNLARVIQALTLAFVHELTGFVEGASTQSPLAQFGIQLHFGLIPAIYLAIGVIIFWKFYDLTPEKVKENKAKLLQMNL